MRNAPERYGFNIDNWFHFEKPDEFNINSSEYEKLIADLENSEIIKRASNEQINFFLTKKGKRELSEPIAKSLLFFIS